MQPSYRAAGVDVSKDSLDLAVFNHPKVRHVPNDDQGCRMIGKWMKKEKIDLLAVEATGGYERRLVRCLQAMQIPVAVVQPSLVRHHAKAKRVLAKTDVIDAKMIADYAQHHQPRTAAAHDQAVVELRALSERRDQLIEDRVREQNRLEACDSKAVAKQLQQSIKRLQRQTEEIDEKIQQCIEKDAELAAKKQALMEVKGIGEVGASVLLIYLPELGSANRQQIAALAGLAPYARESGQTRKKRTIFGGRGRVREALYMCAGTAALWNLSIRPMYDRLIAAGKKAKIARIACARKLLVYLNSKLAKLARETQAALCAESGPGENLAGA
jgi:transposase